MQVFLRLFLISASSALTILFALFFLGKIGSSQGYQPPHHPWVGKDFLIFSQKECSPEGLAKTQTESPTSIHAISLVIDSNGQWFVECAPNYSVDLLLEKLPKLSYLFDVKGRSDAGLRQLEKSLALLENNPAIGFRSRSHVVLLQLRKVFPQWLFVADPTTMVKIHLFESLHLESLADAWPDIFITDGNPHRADNLTDRLLKELQHRKKIIIWDDTTGGQTSPAVVPEAIAPYLNGILTNRPSVDAHEIASRFKKP